jgi:hypothetical protein
MVNLDFGVIILLLIMYLFCPERIIGSKYEYVYFFLVSSSICIVALFLIDKTLFGNPIVNLILCPKIIVPAVFYVIHLLYPFKIVKRNKHVSFFLLGIVLYFVIEMWGLFILHAFFGENM